MWKNAQQGCFLHTSVSVSTNKYWVEFLLWRSGMGCDSGTLGWGSVPGPAEWVKDLALPQLQPKSDLWPGNSISWGATKKKKKKNQYSRHHPSEAEWQKKRLENLGALHSFSLPSPHGVRGRAGLTHPLPPAPLEMISVGLREVSQLV